MISVEKVCGLVRPDVGALRPYQVDCVVSGMKLDANENGWDVPGAAREELIARLRKLAINRYPDPRWSALRRALAERHAVTQEQILIGNGSSELILALMHTFIGQGVRVVYPAPSFSMYPIYATIAGATSTRIMLDQDYRLDPDTMIAASQKPDTGLVMLCSPNNPTGNAMPLADIEKIIANSGCVVAVDEAYFEFHGETALSLVAKYPNVVILRTFSKAFGLAGARVGYLIGQAPVVSQIAKVVLPYNVNALSLTMAEVVMSQMEAFLPRIQAIIEERERVTEVLQAMPRLTVNPSRANFLLFKTPAPSNAVADQLQQAGILVKDFGKGIPDAIRVSIGTPAENNLFLQALRSILRGILND